MGGCVPSESLLEKLAQVACHARDSMPGQAEYDVLELFRRHESSLPTSVHRTYRRAERTHRRKGNHEKTYGAVDELMDTYIAAVEENLGHMQRAYDSLVEHAALRCKGHGSLKPSSGQCELNAFDTDRLIGSEAGSVDDEESRMPKGGGAHGQYAPGEQPEEPAFEDPLSERLTYEVDDREQMDGGPCYSLLSDSIGTLHDSCDLLSHTIEEKRQTLEALKMAWEDRGPIREAYSVMDGVGYNSCGHWM